jgi:hypothetical protein
MRKILLPLVLLSLFVTACDKTTDQQTRAQEPSGKINWNTYASPAQNGFSFKYPQDFSISTDRDKIQSLSYLPISNENTVAYIYYSGDGYKGTNFEHAGVSINISKNMITDAKCNNFGSSADLARNQVADVRINGIAFKSATGSDAGVGHSLQIQVYRNFHNNACYEIALRVGSANIGNFAPGTVKEFNQNEIWQRLQEIVKTFTFTS